MSVCAREEGGVREEDGSSGAGRMSATRSVTASAIAYSGEVASALLTSGCVSPLVALVDKAIFMHASGKMDYSTSFQQCLKMFLVKPSEFFARKTFWWSNSVYMCTFMASNCSERLALESALEYPARLQLLAVCSVNLPLSAMRDRHLVRVYSLAPTRPVGHRTTAAFVLRDVITMTGAFSSIGPVSAYLESFGLSALPARIISQMLCPVVALVINTPIFMYGLHIHNFPNAGAIKMLQYIWNNYWDTLYWARMARVGTAYSVGGMINTVCRAVLTPPLPRSGAGSGAGAGGGAGSSGDAG